MSKRKAKSRHSRMSGLIGTKKSGGWKNDLRITSRGKRETVHFSKSRG